ncbi:MAG: class I SAM-dependent methyltransferase [Candidatus Brocadiaceae bacterium]|nr:class I SAM-dependent methyltransferase [Candidatus Brocadiaceae bacterium]
MEMPKVNVRAYSGLKGEEHWNTYWKGFNFNATKRATYELTVRNTLELIKEHTKSNCNLCILDLGCGQGDIDILIALQSNSRIIATDLSEKALKVGREQISKYGLEKRISLIKGDGYELGFRDNSFDVLLSFGYGSAGSYTGVQEEIYRVLKPGGIAIIDFIHHLSLYNVLRPKFLFRQWRRYRSGKEAKVYHFGKFGVEDYFKRFGLVLEDIRLFNTYPPMGDLFSHKSYMLFEDTFGRLFKPVLARVFLAKFRKV